MMKKRPYTCALSSALFMWPKRKKHKVMLFMGPKSLLNKLILHYLSHNYFGSTNASLIISRYFIYIHLGTILLHH